METGLVLLSLVMPLMVGHETISEELYRIEQAQAVIVEEQMRLEEEQKLQEQKEKLLHETVTEGLIIRLESLDRIRYRAGRFDIENNAFDCSGLIKAYGVARGILTEQEAVSINSTVLYLLGDKKKLSEARRGDITYRSPIGDETLKHIAVVTRDYDPSEGGIWIIDNAPGNGGKVEERFLQMRGDVFVGRWKILIASNPLIEVAKNKELEFAPMKEYVGMFHLSRYYTPVEGQDSYFNGSYEADFTMNCSGDCTITANGTKLTNKLVEKVISCPPEYPLGTKLWIEDWIEVTCVDRGGSIQGRRLDIWAGIGQEGLNNIRNNEVVTGRRNIYKQNLHSKPINETKISLLIYDLGYSHRYVVSTR